MQKIKNSLVIFNIPRYLLKYQKYPSINLKIYRFLPVKASTNLISCDNYDVGALNN